ncbi:MAG TPA: hypothetical protein PK624_01810 [Spirochaetota bacterium]|nr:hypothetical protein [Spirochaetota bacterium]HOR43513.1 hypothetical protein [Spirochaetota bacterium]HOU83212.1 hypothetical protein [Spirochaetota bacterium]HPK55394.1 hypothetical protein [Spirochaetota bacterium]HQE57555.1 hypothetical protein [Spirochaetota bacterium]
MRYLEEEIITRKSALSTSERDEWEKQKQNLPKANLSLIGAQGSV